VTTLVIMPRDVTTVPVRPPAVPPAGAGASRSAAPVRRWAVPAVVGVLVLVGLVALAVSRVAPAVPTLLIAIALGMALRAAGLVPAWADAGLAWTAKHVLRAGVVLLGLQLSLRDVAGLGAGEIVVLLLTVAATFGTALVLGRALRVPERLRLLVGTGFSICGASAVAAMSAVLREQPAPRDQAGPGAAQLVEADEELDKDVAVAVALVTLYGTLALLLLPLLARAFGLSDRVAGLWIGLSVHEVAQVVAAAATVSAAALTVAVVAKLARVVLLAPLVAGVGLVRRRAAAGGRTGTGRATPLVPLFVVGFLALVVVRSTGLLPQGVLDVAKAATTVAFTAALTALGTQVHLGRLLRGGGRVLALAGLTTVAACTVSLGGLLVVGAL